MPVLTINAAQHDIDLPEDTPLLWVLRDELGLLGTRYGCGAALCGCCTVHADGKALRSCVATLADVAGAEITTIEGLGTAAAPHPVQTAWLEIDVAQCGYCQSGQIMSAAALLNTGAPVNDDSIRNAMSGNICRCGTYGRINKAIKRAANAPKEA